MIRIVHLSDTHLCKSLLYDAENFVLRALIDDLKKFNTEKQIDLITITGDLIDKGGKDFNDDILEAFLTFEEKIINSIAKDLNLSNMRFFICPGNHDIDRNADSIYEERGLSEILLDTEKVNEFISSKNEVGIKRVLTFKDFEKSFYKNYPESHIITNFHSSYTTSIDSIKLGITCFNTCWRSYDSAKDKEKLILGERQIIDARRIIKECDMKIAILHHPIDWLTEFDRKAVQNFLQKDYDIILCGHVHEGSSWINTNYYGGVFVSVAPSNWSYNIRDTKRMSANGYSIIDYDIRKQKIKVHHQRYNHQKESYIQDTDLGIENGYSFFDIPKTSEQTAIQEELALAIKIEEVHFESINEHLLTYNTDTKAPKKIEQLFVQPRIAKTIDPDPEKEEEEEIFNITELCMYFQ